MEKTNAHRFVDILGIVTYQVSSGKNGKVTAHDYASGTEYPEILSSSPVPLRSYENGKQKVTYDYHEAYPSLTDKEIIKEVETNFARAIETSKTKDINPEAYEAIKMMAEAGLQKRYGITLQNEEDSLGRSM